MALSLIVNVMQSQVTIGTLTPPLKGVLLDLKQQTETDGAVNSTNGMKFPRIALNSLTSLQPMLSSSEDDAATATTKLQYKGMIVYNVTVNAGANLQEGLYVWDGTQWEVLQTGNDAMAAVNAGNGLNLSAINDTVKLGGTLTESTTIDLSDKNLLFSRSSGNIGIGTDSPEAPLHIYPSLGGDPLIVDSVRYTSATNPIDGATPNYYNLQISDKGVVRKSPIVNNLSEKYIYTLSPQVTIAIGDNLGNNGSQLKWMKDGIPYDYITLPEDGAYVFNFRLYGTTTGAAPVANSFYLCAFIGSMSGTPADAQEIIVSTPSSNYLKATYSATITLAGKTGNHIYFKIGELSDGHLMNWTLLGIPNTGMSETSSNRTSMIFWKI